ncbi:hypothetical protein ACHQM5_000592 [Ranunculus cassubicifolius]
MAIPETSSSTTTTTNTSSTTSIPPLTTTHIQHLINPKLDHTNFQTWRAQFYSLLEAFEIEGYVDGTYPCPPKSVAGSTEVNPEFTAWKKQDKLIIAWLFVSITEHVMALILGLKTSRDMWLALEGRYASQSIAEQMRLRRSLQHIRKGNLSMQEYLLKAKRLSDSLAAAGPPSILTSLESSYDAIVTTLTTTMNSISMSDFQAHLLAYDMRLEDQTRLVAEPPSANVARRSSSTSGRTNQHSHQQNQNNQHNRNTSRDGRRFAKISSQSSFPFSSETY